MFCTQCGSSLSEKSNFCPYCGAKVRTVSPRSDAEDVSAQSAADSACVQVPDSDRTVVCSRPAAAAQIENTETGIEQSAFVLDEPASEVSPEPDRKRRKGGRLRKAAVVLGALGLAAVLALILIPLHNDRQEQYDRAAACMEREDYASAQELFSELGHFRDADDRAEQAQALLDQRIAEYNDKLDRYHKAQAYFESGAYAKALSIFEELEGFEDADDWAAKTNLELDYLNIDALSASGEYDRIINALRARSERFGNTADGEQAARLADEYAAVSDAIDAMQSGAYLSALSGLESLDLLRDDYKTELLLCRAYLSKQEHDWTGILVNLYALQIGDADRNFLNAPNGENDALVASAAVSAPEDPTPLLELIRPGNSEAKALKTAAENGYAYEAANAALENREYAQAMQAFESLGPFLDSVERLQTARQGYLTYEKPYQQAEEYFSNQEFYKAQALYLDIPDYKDSQQKAAACVRPLPENGAMNVGNGYGMVLTIQVPAGTESVFLKLYDESGAAAGHVFIRPGMNATINMLGGNYTMKVAYGTEWYGETDLFGENGSYQQLLNGNDSVFELESGYSYTLTLGGVTDGNVGSKSVGGADGM